METMDALTTRMDTMARLIAAGSLLLSLCISNAPLLAKTTIAVLDTGSSIDDIRGVSFTRTSPFEDNCGHGTLMVKIIRDVNPHAEIIMVKIADSRSDYSAETIVRGLEWCRSNGVDVVNCSFTINEDERVKASVTNLIACGVTVVAAVGNCSMGSGFVVGPDKMVYRAANFQGGVGFPANIDTVIGVGAIDFWGKRADFARDAGELSADGTWYGHEGTSISTARVSGYITLLMERYPQLTCADVRTILHQVAHNKWNNLYLSKNMINDALADNTVAQVIGDKYQLAMR